MNDRYVRTAPSAENAINIFRGEWATNVPGYSDVTGPAPQFEDVRIAWALSVLGGAKGMRVLDLGPLEGGQSYMMERAGASYVLGVEANTRAYLRCLVVKELLQMRASFVCGDVVEYLKTAPRFDIVLANGILYHMVNPVELIEFVSRVTDTVVMWTHYHDEATDAVKRTPAAVAAEHGGFKHTLYNFSYAGALQTPGFCGGTEDSANRLSRSDLFAALTHFGFTKIDTDFDHPGHPNGPAIAIVARRV